METAITLRDIDLLAETLAAERDALRQKVTALESEYKTLLVARLPQIRAVMARAKEAEDLLAIAIARSPDLWQKPRTRSLHGIKCGLRTLPDKILFEDPEQSVKLIRKHLPAQAEILIRTKESPNNAACAELPVMDLKRIGGRLEMGAEQIVIQDTLSDLAKFVALLMSQIEGEGQ